MPRLAVITAPNPGYDNPGMLTVDLALHAFLRRFDPGLDVDWYVLVPPDADPTRDSVDPGRLPFRFRPLAGNLDAVYGSDAILFWGDFLHARCYLEKDAARHVRHYLREPDPDAGQRLLRACYLLADAPDAVLGKTVLFGGTVLPDPEPDDSQYGRAFRRLVGGVHAVRMREPVSAERVARLRGVATGDCLGLDPAFLLRRDDIEEGAPGATPTVGAFAGVRTPVPPGFVRFCRALARRLDARVEWVPWLRFRKLKPRRWRRHAARLALGGTGRRVAFEKMVGGLAHHRAVVTDTYHLCVNSWRQGTPAIGLGRAAEPMAGSLGDRKKRILYEMLGASGFYIPIGAKRLPGADRFADIVPESAPVIQRLHQTVDSTESALARALKELLHPSAE